MNYLEPFDRFLRAVSDDPRIGASHISLYMTLLHYWIVNKGIDPLALNRREVMKTAKINGIATYHRRIRELHAYGYIRYVPSYHPKCHTRVYLSSHPSNAIDNNSPIKYGTPIRHP